MFGKKNFTNTQIKGQIVNPNDDIFINVDNNDLTLYSKYKTGSRNTTNKSLLEFKDELSDIKLYQSSTGLLDYNGKELSANNNLEEGLVLWYDKIINNSSGYITDKSGSNNTGTLTSIIDTINDNSIYFDGTNDYIKSSSSVINSDSNVSVAVWVKPTAYVATTQFILGQVNTLAASSNANNDYKVEIVADNKVYFAIHADSSNTILTTTGNATVSINRWNHIACTYNTLNTNTANMCIYLNGVLVEKTTAANTLSADWPVCIGIGCDGEAKFSGYMKDIRIYDRTLETNEVINIYNLGSVEIADEVNFETISMPTANIYLKMQEGSSTNIINYGSTDTSGTLVNNAAWSYKGGQPCVSFDGTDDYLTLEATDDFTGALTISLWIYLNNTNSGQTFISNQFANAFDITMFASTIIFFNGTGDGSTYTAFAVNKADIGITNNEWHHITVTRDRGDANVKSFKFYFNGKKYEMYRNVFTTSLDIGSNDNTINIGRRVNASNYTNGYINNVRIYNQELSETQILKLYKDDINNASSSITPINTTNKLNTALLTNKPLTISNYKSLLLNLTGQDNTTTTYVSDYSINGFNANVSTGSLTYSASNAATISASNTLSFNGLSGLSLDGTKNDGVKLENLYFNELTFATWMYLYDLSDIRAIFNSSAETSYLNNIYIDTNGRVNIVVSNNLYNSIIFNDVLSVETWYYITVVIVNNDVKCFIGTTTTEPVEINKYQYASLIADDFTYNNLVAHYKFNELNSTTTISDYGLNDITGTCAGLATTDLSLRGYSFDGSDNKITLTTNPLFYTTNLTVSILFKANSISTTDKDIISTSQGVSNGYSGYILRIKNTTGDVQFIAQEDFGDNRITATLSSAITVDTLTHLVLRITTTGSTFKVDGYKNGSSTTATASYGSSAFNWTSTNVRAPTIGDNPDSTLPFNGYIYDVQFFNKALTTTEIDNLYNMVMYKYNQYDADHSLNIGICEMINLGTTKYFSGELDDIKLYSTALSGNDIISNWNSGAVKYFSTTNSATDLLINLDGEPGNYTSSLDEIATVASKVDDGLSVAFSGVGSSVFTSRDANNVLYLKLNEGTGTTVYDEKSYNNGTLTNGPVWESKITPINEDAVYLDGIDDCIIIANDAGYSLNGALSICCWIYPYNNGTNTVIFSKEYYGEFDIRLRSDNDTFMFYHGSATEYEAWTSAVFTGLLKYNEWNYFVLTRDTGASVVKDIRIYINGNSLPVYRTGGSPAVGNFTIRTTTTSINIGRRYNDSLYTEVKVSQFRIYNYELTQSEVLDIYNYTNWSSNVKFGNFAYNLNSGRKLTITTNETAGEYSGELWIKPEIYGNQTILKSDYTTSRSNGDIKLSLVALDGNNASNLIGNWNCYSKEYVNGSLIDYSGNGTDITLSDGFLGTDSNIGLNYNNSVLYFDNSNNYAEENITTGNYFYDNFNQNEFTVTCWVNVTSFSSNNGIFTLMINDGSRNATDKIIHLIVNSTGTIRFQTVNTSLSINSFDTTYTISLNEWVHLGFTFDTSLANYKRIYVNGIDRTVGTTTENLNNLATNNYLVIGRGYTTGNNMFAGSITDLRFYNKALSQYDIQTIMNQNLTAELNIKLGGSITSICNNNALLSLNNWNHLAFNYNSSMNYLKLYINGENVANNLALTNTTDINSNIIIGDNNFDGSINNFIAYSRNLTDNEIKRLALCLDRLKIHLSAYNQKNSVNAANVILTNKSINPPGIYIRANGAISLINKENGFNNIINFNGSSCIVLDPLSSLWKNRSFSLLMWIKPSSSGSGTNQHIFSRYLSSSYQSYYIAYDYTNQNIIIGTSSTNTKSIPVVKGIYTHLGIIFDNKHIYIYINGTYTGTLEIYPMLNIYINSSLNTIIGANSDLGGFYNGYLYDFRYYDASLSADAVRSIYAGYDLDNGDSTDMDKELKYISTNKTVVSNKDYIQPAKSSLILHLNNYTTGSIITSSSDNGLSAVATSMTSSTSEFVFNGSSSYLTLANSSELNLTGTTLTISMWINPDTLSGPYILLMKELSGSATSASNNDYAVHINSSNNLVFKLTSTTVTSDTSIITSEWQHITAVYNGTNMKLYINGVVEGTTTSYSSSIVNAVSGNILIGANSVGGELFDGKIRDIRIYNSELSLSDINLIYNGGLSDSGEYSIAGNKKVANGDKYAFISKYLIDNKDETSAVLNNIACDSLYCNYNNSNSGVVLLDQSVNLIPHKKLIRPSYLSSTKLIEYSAHNATLSSSGLISVDTGTINSNSLVFDGNTTSNLIITDGANAFVNEWSVALWYKLSDTGSKNVILSRKEASKNFDIFIDTDGEIKYKYNTTTYASNVVINTNDYNWHHLALTKGQQGLESNIITFYHNGELVRQRNTDLALTTGATQLIIASDNTDGFNGYMDDIRLYTTKLNDVEIAKLSRNELIVGPVHNWLMEDNINDVVVRDVGTAGNNLKLQGIGTTWDTLNVKYGSRSIKFDGTTSNYASSASCGVLGSNPRSIGMWFKRSISTDEGNDQELISYGNSGVAGEQFSIVINTVSNIQVNIGSTSNIRGTVRINDTDWHYLTILQLPGGYYSDDRAIKIFVDSNECTDTATYTEITINTKVTGVNDLLSLGKSFKGYINEVVMYNCSLSKSEVESLYVNKNYYMLNLE